MRVTPPFLKMCRLHEDNNNTVSSKNRSFSFAFWKIWHADNNIVRMIPFHMNSRKSQKMLHYVCEASYLATSLCKQTLHIPTLNTLYACAWHHPFLKICVLQFTQTIMIPFSKMCIFRHSKCIHWKVCIQTTTLSERSHSHGFTKTLNFVIFSKIIMIQFSKNCTLKC